VGEREGQGRQVVKWFESEDLTEMVCDVIAAVRKDYEARLDKPIKKDFFTEASETLCNRAAAHALKIAENNFRRIHEQQNKP